MHAARELLCFSELAMSCRCWVNDQAAHIANVGNVAVQLQCFNKLLTGFAATLDVECNDGPEATAFEVLLRACMPWARWQACPRNALNACLLAKVVSYFRCIFPVTIHAQ